MSGFSYVQDSWLGGEDLFVHQRRGHLSGFQILGGGGGGIPVFHTSVYIRIRSNS